MPVSDMKPRMVMSGSQPYVIWRVYVHKHINLVVESMLIWSKLFVIILSHHRNSYVVVCLTLSPLTEHASSEYEMVWFRI